MPRAARRCPGDLGRCENLIRHTPYCPEHTVAWKGPRTASSRATGKHAWKAHIVPAVLERDGYTCQIRYPDICTGRATVVDKIIPAARRPDLAHNPSNLRASCSPCNQAKARTEDRRPIPRRR